MVLLKELPSTIPVNQRSAVAGIEPLHTFSWSFRSENANVVYVYFHPNVTNGGVLGSNRAEICGWHAHLLQSKK
jgi:hypothetical protein